MNMRGGFYGRFQQRFPGPRPFHAPTPAYMPPSAPIVIRPPPFDPYLCEEHFPRLPEGDDTTISQVQFSGIPRKKFRMGPNLEKFFCLMFFFENFGQKLKWGPLGKNFQISVGAECAIGQVFAQTTFLVDYCSSCRTDSKCW
jgi:hypothetical protein